MSRLGGDEDAEMAAAGAARKKKPLACRRCRHRKQKCTEVRPCENCTQSGAECIPQESVASMPVIEQDYVQRLEERVAELETLLPQERVDHVRSDHVRPGNVVRPPPPMLRHPHPPPRAQPPPEQLPQHWPPAYDAPSYDTLSGPGPGPGPGPGLFGVAAGLHEPPPPPPPPSVSPAEAPSVAPDMQQFLVRTYFDMAQSQYPVLLRHEFNQWLESWSRGAPASARWQGFFVYMVYAIAFLMTKSRVSGPTRSQEFFALATTRYLPYVLQQPGVLLRAQALLLLTVYALHVPSRDDIIALATRAVRFCVENHLHLAEAEPAPADDPPTLVEIQLRRRLFWCAYALDRVVCGSHDLPVSVADHYITVPLFDNIDDDTLDNAAAAHAGAALPVARAPTSVSSALHVIEGRQIESEIQDAMLRRDWAAAPASPAAFAWRARVLAKLKAWNARSRAAAEPSHKGYASLRWHKMIYYYNVVTLYRLTRAEARLDGRGGEEEGENSDHDHDHEHAEVAGKLVVQASCQALLLFRRFQMAREIAQPWLGLLSQFQIGVALLYCFFAAPPPAWPAAYHATDVPDAVRACSSTLAVLAERWVEAECVRDVFEVLAREVPFGASWDRPRRMSDEGRAAIHACWPAMVRIVMDRPTLGMIREMANDAFAQAPPTTTAAAAATATVTATVTATTATTTDDGPVAAGLQAADTIVVGGGSDAGPRGSTSTSPAVDLFDGMDMEDMEWARDEAHLDMTFQAYRDMQEAQSMYGWLNGVEE